MLDKKECGFCHAQRNGDRNMIVFSHPNNRSLKASLSIQESKLSIVVEGEYEVNQLACPIGFCPFCGRCLSEKEAEVQSDE